METLAAGVYRGLEQATARPMLIHLGRSQRNLWWFLPYAAARTAALRRRRDITHVICGDAITYMAMRPALRGNDPRTYVMVMGLDLTFPNTAYQRVLHRSLPHAYRVVAISDASRDAAIRAGVAPDRIRVLRPGVEAPERTPEERIAARERLCHRLRLDPSAFIALTLGRLIRRKGVRWFAETVLPELPVDVVYLVAGDGPERDAIAEAAAGAGVAHRVRLLGGVDDGTREELLTGADLLVMPNVPVSGDMEGFGLVAVEAALRGTPVLASRLEGIRDAVRDDVTGFLCEPLDVSDYVDRITAFVKDRPRLIDSAARFQVAARASYGFDVMVREMRSSFEL
jgi:glycosyltransferase involved in cell wall biosynthesis